MIGLLFLGALVIWVLTSVWLGSAIQRWLGIKRHPVGAGFIFALIVFVAPVADEIIAYPQLQEKCKALRPYHISPGMTETSAYGRTVFQTMKFETESLWPSSVKIKRVTVGYEDSVTGESVISHSWIEPLHGFLNLPNGSAGGAMPVILSICRPPSEPYSANGRPLLFDSLHLQK